MCHQKLTNRDIVSYRKTSYSLKHKEKRSADATLKVDYEAQDQAHKEKMKEYLEITKNRKNG